MVVGDLAVAVDVVVLGAGPGGYVAAIRAAQLGQEVVLVDPGPPGGTCLHAGCIPSKALLAAANCAWQVSTWPEMGITTGQVQIDLAQMQAWKNQVVGQLAKGVKQLLDRHKVQFVSGLGWFMEGNEVRVEGEYGAKRFVFENCIIAVGADPAPLPGLAFDGQRILTPGQALGLTDRPENLAVIGSSTIAAEIAIFYAKLRVPVRLLIPSGRQFLAEFDPAAGRQVLARLKKLGVKVETNVDDLPGVVAGADRVVVAAGLTPRTGRLDLGQVEVKTDDRGFIPVDDRLRTSNPSIYAVGDVTGGPPLASVAYKQGKIAAEHIAGRPVQYAPQALPRMAWTDPEVAAVGLTPAEAEAAGYKIITGRFPLAANGRALTLNAGQGFVLTVAEEESEILLGMTVVGPQAEALIGKAALALEMGATLTDLVETMHPHPGLGEALLESAEAALGVVVHSW